MRLVIMQPSYIPWLGYFDLLIKSALFLFYDNVQYDKDGWRNRNKIKTPAGAQWLTVPVLTKGLNKPTNKEIKINNCEPWRRKHLKALEVNYSKAPYFDMIYPMMESVLSREWEFLIDLNRGCLDRICEFLGIRTPMKLVSELALTLPEERNDKLIEICRHVQADEFYEPQGGKNYIDAGKFESHRIRLMFQDYQHPVYPQLYGAFESHLSVVDLLFNCGPESLAIINGTHQLKKEQQT